MIIKMPLVHKKILFLFDIDGTLTYSRKIINQNVIDILLKIKSNKNFSLAVVGGSDYNKISEQIKHLEIFDYIFPENGVIVYKNNEKYFSQSIVNTLGEERLKKLINYCLTYIANLDIPKKRGTFIELRNGIINISPIGRNCSYDDRKEFVDYNLKNDILNKFRTSLIKEFEGFNLTFSIGGQISIDCFPLGWDKRFCLRHVDNYFEEIYFFGDKTEKGGNDYEIYNDKRVKGYSVKNPEDTIEILKNILDL